MRIIASLALPAAAVLLVACTAVAQDRQEGGPGRVVPEDRAASGSSQPPAENRSLSEKLSEQGGVIRPPANVDPAMKQAPPATGPQSMPVIPPPGTTPGSPVEPK